MRSNVSTLILAAVSLAPSALLAQPRHDHGRAWTRTVPVGDLKSFWGALGCSCFAF